MKNPLLSIWIKPKETIVNLIERKRTSIYGLPFFIIGASLALDVGPEIFNTLDSNTSIGIRASIYLFLTLLFTGLIFVFLGHIQPWFIKLIGKIWNGQATKKQIANVNALSSIPYVLILIYQIILLFVGKEPLRDLINPIFSFIIWILGMRILIIGISLAQRFSYGIALLNLLISILPLIILRLLLINY